MTKSKQITFNEYRYQLLPISQHIQIDAQQRGEVASLDDLKAKKNIFLCKIINEIKEFIYARGTIVHKLLWVDELIFILQLGIERDLKRTTREFTKEQIEHWPTVYVVFYNNPLIQKCLIQQGGGFQNTSTVASIIETTLNQYLSHYHLAIAFEPIYEQEYFWDLVQRYEGRIMQIDFELISPNMSNISASLNLDLTNLNKSTNTQKTHLQLNSDPKAYLTPSQNDPLISNIVEYSSQGGGNISVRARGVKKKMNTSKGVNEVNISELSIEGASPEALAALFRELLR